MRYFLINLMLIFLVTSCGALPEAKWKAVENGKKSIVLPYFTRENIVYSYKTNVAAYGKELSGILIIKKVGDERFRVAMTTEFGNTLFDIEISPKDYVLITAVEDLNRKIIINTLVSDFRLLLKSQYKIDATFNDGVHLISKSGGKDDAFYLFQTDASDVVFKIENFKGDKKKKEILYATQNNVFARKIIIEHFDIKLKMTMEYSVAD